MLVMDADRWQPQTPADRDLVLRELDGVLSSPHFRNSKRYPKLLRYVVTQALAGDTQQFKERTLGIEVFDRPADYDTNADPIVRVAAGEVRKRLAQHYHENGSDSGLEISLALGSYLPCFRRLSRSHDAEPAVPHRVPPIDAADAPNKEKLPLFRRRVLRALPFRIQAGLNPSSLVLIVWIGIAVGIATLTGYLVHQGSASKTSENFWNPLLQSPGSVLTVIPTSLHSSNDNPPQSGVDLSTLSHGPYNRISMCDAVALSHLAGFLGNHSKAYEVKEANLTSLGDLHQRSAILIGALNNHWTMSLTEPMRFHFVQEPFAVRIVDRMNPQNRDWVINYKKPYAYAEHDFAIIARYSDPTTRGNVLVIAGIGAHATQAASEFVATSSEIEPLRRIAPSEWESKNLEMIVRTDVINGESSPAKLIALTTW